MLLLKSQRLTEFLRLHKIQKIEDFDILCEFSKVLVRCREYKFPKVLVGSLPPPAADQNRNNMTKKKAKKQKHVLIDCPTCNGTSEVKERSGWSSDRNRRYSKPNDQITMCDRCDGTGQIDKNATN